MEYMFGSMFAISKICCRMYNSFQHKSDKIYFGRNICDDMRVISIYLRYKTFLILLKP